MSQAGRFVGSIGPKSVPLAVDEVIGALAGRQHGVVGRAQLIASGVGSDSVKYRINAGRLHPLYRGVYAVGHRVLSQRGRWMAATLATDGVLSHRSAAALWGIRPSHGRIEVTTPRTRAKRPGLLLHRAVLAEDEITTHDGIPVTTPARTLLDLAGVLQRHQLQRAINEAEILRLEGPHELADRHPTKRGTRALRTLAPPTHTRRDLEARFTTFLNDRRFPTPQTNILIEGKEVDAAWPDRKIIVELDSWEYHRTRQAFEEDRRRDRRLAAAGWTVIRITWRDLDDPDALEGELRAPGLAPGPR
jgi:very-short-patch-repair endonuclease